MLVRKWRNWNPHYCWWNVQWCKLWKIVWKFLKRLALPYDTATPLLSIYPNKLETDVQTKTYTQIFIATLFIITKKWKQSNPNVHQLINR